MNDRLNATDLLGARVLWLLDLHYAGLTLRLSDAEVEVLTNDGDSLHYDGELGVLSISEGLDFLADASGSPASASLECVLPIDAPAMIAAGHDLAGATAELSRWIEGTPYESRRRVIVGAVSDPEYGAQHEPVSFTVEAAPWLDTVKIPRNGHEVTGRNLEDDWILTLPTDALGRRYPIVIGRPGVVSTAIDSSGRIGATQAVPVWLGDVADAGSPGDTHDNMWIIADHHCVTRRVYVTSDTATTMVRQLAFNGRDRAGHPVCYIPWWGFGQNADPNPEEYPYAWYRPLTSGSFAYGGTDDDGSPTHGAGSQNALAELQDSSGPAVYVAWADDIEQEGGLADADGTTLRDAGGVLEWLLGQSGAPIDHGRFAAVRPLLSGFKLDFTIDEQVTPWEFIVANILPILPVSIVSGPDGLYPIVWRYDARAEDAVCALDTGSDPYIERASNVSYDRSKIYNDFEFKYALNLRTGDYLGTHRLSADDSEAATPSFYCALSQRRYRRADGSAIVSSMSVASLCVYEDATAQAVLGWMSRAYAFARRRVSYICPEATYGWLSRGQIVAITDADVHFAGQLAMIEDIVTDGSPMLRLKLLLVEDIVRDARA